MVVFSVAVVATPNFPVLRVYEREEYRCFPSGLSPKVKRRADICRIPVFGNRKTVLPRRFSVTEYRKLAF
jgi:hypothetical protein